MDKKTAFRQLCEDVSRCHLCQQMVSPPHCANGEYLENDDHGLDTDMPYVNLWNLWRYDLDAEILVIGQDYGTRVDTVPIFVDPTEEALKILFSNAFGVNVTDPNAAVFFTNAANCYRHNKTTGGTHSGWLPICANKFFGRLISIIQPKIIIALGGEAFNALTCLDGLPLTCRNPQNNVADTLSERMKHDYFLTLDGVEIPVFPVYHTGALGRRNRSMDKQIEDWKRIAAATAHLRTH